jgi:uncharacterized protein YjbJ (UPF0337 family)
MGKLKDTAKGLANELAGNVKQASDDPRVRGEGRKQERKGEVQQAVGKVKGAVGNRI